VTALDEGRSAIGEITSKVLAKDEKEARSFDWWGRIMGVKGGKWRKRIIDWPAWLCFTASI
jgi:hypothetical protein